MAEAAAHLPLHRAAAWLARPSPAARYGLKLGSAAAASLWAAYASGLPQPTWAPITVLVVCQPTSGGSIQKGLLRLAGTIAAAAASIALFGAFAQQPLLLLASLFGAYAVAVYGMTGPRYPYAWQIFGLTTGIILIDALTGVDQVETLAFDRAALVALGIVIVAVADALFWPAGVEETLRGSLAQRARQIQGALKRTLDSILEAPGRAARAPSPPSSPLTQELSLIPQLQMEIGASRARAVSLSRVALLLESLASRVRLMDRSGEAKRGALTSPLRAALAEVGERLDEALGEVAATLAQERVPARFDVELERSLAAFEAERVAVIEAHLREQIDASAAVDSAAGAEPERATPMSALAAVLQDIVALLRSLEKSLSGLADAAGETKAGRRPAQPAPRLRDRLTVDRLRLERALRAGLAGCAALIAVLALGWPMNSVVPAIAFIAASGPTRGAVVMVAVLVIVGGMLSWAISDLSIVFLFTHLDRMPPSLLYPFALAGGLGYMAVRRPALAPLTVLVTIMAILSVFGGDAPPQGVAGPYNTTVYLLLGAAVGLIAQRLLWPRTATQLFQERAAAQLELCRRAFGGPDHGADEAGRHRATAELVSGYGQQLALLGPLHKQAHLEPPENALDDARRAALLVLTQDLFDAALRSPRTTAADWETVPPDAASALSSLRTALLHRDEALEASMAAASRAMCSDPCDAESCELASSLAAAHQAVETRIDELRGRRDLARAFGARGTDAFLAHVDAGRRLVTCQLAIEAWLTDWRQIAATAEEWGMP